MRKTAVIILFCLCVITILAAGCASQASPEAEQKESVSLVVSSDTSNTVSVVATNLGTTELQFDIYVDCYDKDNLKFDGTIVHIPYLKSGERGKGTAYLPKGTARYSVDTVGATSSNGVYRVYFTVKYQ